MQWLDRRSPPGPIAALILVGLACCTGRAWGQADPVAKALADLDSKDHAVRIEAAKALGGEKAAKNVVSTLVRRLADPDWGVQVAVCDALGRLAAAEATQTVAQKAIDGDIFFVREAALRAVADLDKNKAIGVFLKAAKSGKGEHRVRGVRALGSLRDPRLIPELSALSKDKDPFIRGEAMAALGPIADGKSGLIMLDVLKGKGFAAQNGALQGLSQWIPREEKEKKRAIAAVAAFLAGNRAGYVIRRARETLGPIDAALLSEALRAELGRADPESKVRIAWVAAELNLRDLAPDLRPFAKEKDEKLRAAAAAALGRIGASDDTTSALLQTLLKDPSPLVQAAAFRAYSEDLRERIAPGQVKGFPPDIRLAAVGAMTRATKGLEEEFPALVGLLDDTDWRVACAAAVALGKLFQERAIESLTKPLRHADWRIRGAAAVAAGKILRKEAIPLLLDALQDKHAIVQGAALKNLQYLTRQTFGLDPASWRNWWGANEKGFTPFDPQDTLKRLRESGYGTDDYIYKLFENMEIVVVSGSWDHVEEVLKDLKLKHQVISGSELDKVHLNPRQIVLLNCGSQVGGKNTEFLLWFVVTGGYLMATDWAIADSLEKIWPGYLASYKKDATNDDVVVSEPCSSDRLLRNVYADHARTKVWLEITSFGIQVNNPYVMTTLVDSLEMTQKYNLDTLCLTFENGLGKVFHSMSHFYLQKQSLQNVRTKQELKIFAIDHLGLDIDQVRRMDDTGDFDAAGKEPLSRHYPVFKLIVNYVDERLRREIGEE